MLRHCLVDRSDLRTIAQPEGLGELDAAVGIDGRVPLRSADRDIDGGGIDGVGREALQMRQDPIARRPWALVMVRTQLSLIWRSAMLRRPINTGSKSKTRSAK